MRRSARERRSHGRAHDFPRAPGSATNAAMSQDRQETFASRRDELMRRLGPRAVAVIHGTRAARRNNDVEHRYRVPSDLLFLTGMTEPESFAVITPGRGERFTMFVRPRDPERETWTGRRLGLEGAISQLKADRAYRIEELREKLVELIDGADEVHYLPGDESEVDELILHTVAHLRAAERKGRRAPTRIVDLRATLHEQRLVKDEAGLGALARAVEISVEAHTLAMRTARPGMREYEIEALVDYTFRRRGAGGPGYGTICGGGVNATILHYVDNADALRAGDLMLIDAGAEWDGFTADITRTFPPGGRFSPAQRRIYQLVLDTEKSCIELVRPGANIEEIHAHAVRRLTEGMVDLGLLAGSVDELIEQEIYKRFYMHRTSHWLGLDVHDAGIYFPGNAPRPLAPGMVLTVEPGLYVAGDAEGVPDEYRGIGVRIEDDVLVTAEGHRVLTIACPKEIADVEALTAS